MAETKKGTRTATKKTSAKASKLWTDEERAAMKEYAREKRSAARGGSKTDGASEVLAKIAEMPKADRAMAERVHAIITTAAPELAPRTWYGMPAYAKDGQVICFFQNAGKFKVRYGTLGFSDKAILDDGDMWPTSYALNGLTAKVEARIAELVKAAVR
jgi:uncharacterized protein YdhG (YjbR/CyaY superfamily)